MIISLLGFMGSGKSFVAQHLGEHLNMDVIDLDLEIEKSEKKTISTIFQENGEQYFREIEHIYLKRFLSEGKNHILSLGGGTPCFFDNMYRINRDSFSIFIDADWELMLSRLAKKPNKRPLVKDKTREQIDLELKSLYQNRRVFYEKSKHILKIDKDSEDIQNIIIDLKKVVLCHI